MAGELETEVLDEPESCRKTTDWLDTLQSGLTDTADRMNRERSTSEAFWQGTAGVAARGALMRHRTDADDIEQAVKDAKKALETFAEEIDTVLARMRQARAVAREAGLQLNGTKILPPEPQGGSSGQGGDSGAMEKKVRAFEEAGNTIADARNKQESAHQALENGMKDPLETIKTAKSYGVWIANGAITHVKGSTEAAKALASEARSFSASAEKLSTAATNADHSAATARSTVGSMVHQAKANVRWDRSTDARKIGGPLSSDARRLATANPGDAVKGGSRLAKGASKALRGVPYAGAVLTIGSEVHDATTGEDAAESAMDAGASIAGGAAGSAVGAAVGSAICPGVGTVIGGTISGMAGDKLATAAEDFFTGE